MDLIQVILSAVIASSVTGSILVFFIRSYIKGRLEVYFKKLEKVDEHYHKQSSQVSDLFLEKRIGFYPSIVEIINRLKNTLETGLTAKYAYEWDAEFNEMCGSFTNSLYQWRYYLPDTIFSKLHDFKRNCQDISVIIDIHTRTENISDNQNYSQAVKDIVPKAQAAIKLHEEIQSLLNDQVSSLNVKEM